MKKSQKVKYITLEDLGSTKLSELVYSVYWDLINFDKSGGIIDMSTYLFVRRDKKCMACLGGIAVLGFCKLEKVPNFNTYPSIISIGDVIDYLDSDKEDQLDAMKRFFDDIRSKNVPRHSTIEEISISHPEKSQVVIREWCNKNWGSYFGQIHGKQKDRLISELLELADMLDASGC